MSVIVVFFSIDETKLNTWPAVKIIFGNYLIMKHVAITGSFPLIFTINAKV